MRLNVRKGGIGNIKHLAPIGHDDFHLSICDQKLHSYRRVQEFRTVVLHDICRCLICGQLQDRNDAFLDSP